MSLFRGSMRTHINGHKELSEHADIITLVPEKVAIPLYFGTEMNPQILVQPGDEVKAGTKIAQFNSRFVVPIYSSVSGKVEAVEDRLHQSLKKVKHVVISNDKKYTKEENPVLDYKTATREELVDFMMNAGIVGCGGAGFPAYVKYKDVKDVENLIINAVECEPYITSDYKVMENDFDLVLTGIKAMKKMSDAKKVLIAIKKTHPEVKIIIITSHDTDEEILTALSAGANAYLIKDTNTPEIYNIIHSVINGAIWLDPRIVKLAMEVFKLQKQHNTEREDIGNLTDREKEVLKLLSEGKSNTEIAKELIISSHTAKVHVSNILTKLAVTDRVQAAVKAYKYNLC